MQYFTCRVTVRILPGYFGGENCISNEYRPTNLLTCSTDMGLLRLLQDIRNAPARLGVSRGFLLGLTEFLKRKRRERAGGGGGERERQTDREEGRRGEQNKNNEKKNQNTEYIYRLNVVSLDFSPGGTYYLHVHRHIGLAFRHRMGRFFTTNPHTWLPISTKIKHAPVSPIFFSFQIQSDIAYPKVSYPKSPIIRP